MHILLINTNPVVSRLFVLCTRDDAVVLDEVSDVASLEEERVYDIIFVDETSYSQDIIEFLSSFKNIKKVFISYQSDSVPGFDLTIKKPFLPSHVMEILEDEHNNTLLDEKIEEEPPSKELEIEIEDELPTIFSLVNDEENVESDKEEIINEESLIVEEESKPVVLNGDEIEKIKSLLEMDDEDESIDEVLSEEEIEAKKVQVIKEQLIAEGLEIVEENEIFDELSIDLDGTLHKKKSKKKKEKSKKKKSKKKKSKKIKFTEKNMEHIEDAVEVAMASMTKKQMKKLLKGKKIEITVKLEDNN